MTIQSLGYIGAGAPEIDDWHRFSTQVLGMEVVDSTTGSLRLRMDDYTQRIVIEKNDSGGLLFSGWEVEDSTALDTIATAVQATGIEVKRESKSLADERFVAELISFADPIGNRVEVFYGPHRTTQAFNPGRSISGFRAGPLGLGHVVLLVEQIDLVLPFYRDVLGFGISDYMLLPFKAYFLHVNARHHSLALIESKSNGIHHFMVELLSLDDVGQGYDLAQQRPDGIGQTLGRHTNDFMTSFYAKSPSNFMVEYGWGGREIDPLNWQSVELQNGPSLWGHDRLWLPEDERARAQALTLDNGRRGVREPVQVMDGNHHRMKTNCPWWQ